MRSYYFQKGISLIFALIALLVMSLIVFSLTGNQQTNIQINANTRSIQLAKLFASNEITHQFNNLSFNKRYQNLVPLALRSAVAPLNTNAPCQNLPINFASSLQTFLGTNTDMAPLAPASPSQVTICLVGEAITMCGKSVGNADADMVCDLYEITFAGTLSNGAISVQSIGFTSGLYKK